MTETIPTHPSVAASRLVIETGENEGMIFPLRESVVSVGRGPENTIQIIDSHMSRKHSLLVLQEGLWLARDLGSKNGTLVNGARIEEDRPLSHNDRVQIGDTIFTYEQEARVRSSSDNTTGMRVFNDETGVVPSGIVKLREQLSPAAGPPDTFAVPARDDERLNAIYQVAEMINSILDPDELLGKVMDVIQRFLVPDRAGILLYEKEGEILAPKVIRRPAGAVDEIVISNSIITQAIKEQAALLVSDAPNDFRFQAAESIVIQKIQSAICVPLICREEVLGVLYLDRRRPSASFQENDLKLVAGVANLAALAIVNARQHKQLLRRHADQRELEIARSIQQNLLPRTMPELPGFQLHGFSEPARMVGGDYFDVVPLPDGRVLLAIADVSGKGVPAAILIAAVRAAVQIEVRNMQADELEVLVERLNQMVYRDTQGAMFVTMVLALLDPLDGTLVYCNAGHVRPLLCHADGHVESLDAGGCFLGIMTGLAYEKGQVELPPDAMLFFFSDGITDVMNKRHETFGLQRVTDLLITSHGLSAEDFCEKLRESTAEFRHDAEPFDDQTVLVLKAVTP